MSHPYDCQATDVVEPPPAAGGASASPGQLVQPGWPGTDVRTVMALGGTPAAPATSAGGSPPDLTIPGEVPGADARHVELSADPQVRPRQIAQLFPELPALPADPQPVAGPGGRPYTLADLQQLATANSPQLRQAASDVEAARGNMLQADAYPNPTVSYQFTPSNNGSTPGAAGFGVDQTIKTGGKLALQRAAAEMDLHSAELALQRARSDLATQVRGAYFAVLVARETVRVSKALAHFTDEVYRLQARMLSGGFAASYEPAALRAQAYMARLGYKQALQTYIYAWKQLVAAVNVRQLPLSEVAGRVDACVPYYDYDTLLAYVLRNHTDVLTARNGIDKARYNLKLAQVTPLPDVDVNMLVFKDYSLAPHQYCPTLSLGVPVPVWDRNRGAILAAEAALVRAEEEPHRVELNLTNTLATAYAGYRNNLDALEYYRDFILPDQVRAYRGTYHRRQIDPNASFGDLVSAQQTLCSDVSTYLQTLGQLWVSVVSVADLIQTDDLFEFSRPQAVPPLPDLGPWEPLPCCHPCAVPDASPGELSAAPQVPSRPEPVPSPIPTAPTPPAGNR